MKSMTPVELIAQMGSRYVHTVVPLGGAMQRLDTLYLLDDGTALRLDTSDGPRVFTPPMQDLRRMSPALDDNIPLSHEELVMAERIRQIAGLGWTAVHDDEHTGGELAQAAAAYFAWAIGRDGLCADLWPAGWDMRDSLVILPRSDADRRRAIVKGIALGMAELERIDRIRAVAPIPDAPNEGGAPSETGGGEAPSVPGALADAPAPATMSDTPAGCQCAACADGPAHASDCAVHNEPAMPAGPCDCEAPETALNDPALYTPSDAVLSVVPTNHLRAQGWRTVREIHEEAAGYGLEPSYFEALNLNHGAWIPPVALTPPRLVDLLEPVAPSLSGEDRVRLRELLDRLDGPAPTAPPIPAMPFAPGMERIYHAARALADNVAEFGTTDGGFLNDMDNALHGLALMHLREIAGKDEVPDASAQVMDGVAVSEGSTERSSAAEPSGALGLAGQVNDTFDHIHRLHNDPAYAEAQAGQVQAPAVVALPCKPGMSARTVTLPGRADDVVRTVPLATTPAPTHTIPSETPTGKTPMPGCKAPKGECNADAVLGSARGGVCACGNCAAMPTWDGSDTTPTPTHTVPPETPTDEVLMTAARDLADHIATRGQVEDQGYLTALDSALTRHYAHTAPGAPQPQASDLASDLTALGVDGPKGGPLLIEIFQRATAYRYRPGPADPAALTDDLQCIADLAIKLRALLHDAAASAGAGQ